MTKSYNLIEPEAWDALVEEVRALHAKIDSILSRPAAVDDQSQPAAVADNVETYWSKKVLTLMEAIQYTGFSKRAILQMASRSLIPHSRPTQKKIFFDREKLERWLLGNPVSTQQEIERMAEYLMRKPLSKRGRK